MDIQNQISALRGMPISGTDMVLREQDPFFGSIGAFTAQALGLTAMGRDGQPTPIFRSNIFGRRDPSMTGNDYRMADIYSRRMADMQAMQQHSFGRSVDRFFDERSLLGKMFLEKDSNGNYVQSPGTVAAFQKVRELATNQGAGMIMGLANAALGYDRGAGMQVFAKNADAIAASTPMFAANAFSMNADGTLSYSRPDVTSAGYQATRTSMANIMNESLQRVMYEGSGESGGILKDWSTTHGISEELASRILSDAAMNGRFNSVTEEDRERGKRITSINETIKKNEDTIREYENFREKASEETKHVFTEKINEIKDANAKLEEEKDNTKKQMSSANLGELAMEAAQYDEERAQKEKEHGDIKKELDQVQKEYDEAESSGDTSRAEALSRRYEDIKAKLDEKDAELKDVIRKQAEVGEKIDGVNRKILEDVSSAVDTAKGLFGNETMAYEELYRMTGGSISRDEGMAQTMNMAMQEYMDIGTSRGLSRQFMASMLTGMNDQVRAGYGSSALFADTGVSALMSARYAKQAALAMGGPGMDDINKQRLEAAVRWRAGNAGASSMRKVLVQLETARKEGAISEEQYEDLAKEMTSGDGRTRSLAQKRLYSVMFNGNVEEGFRQMNNGALMTQMENTLGTEGSKAVDRLFAATEANETQEADMMTGQRRRLTSEKTRLKLSGLSQKEISRMESNGGLSGAMSALDKLIESDGEGSMEASLVKSQIQEIMAGASSPEEGRKKALEFLNGAGRSILGTQFSEVSAAALGGARDALANYNEKEVGGKLKGAFAEDLKAFEGALTKDGKLTRENLALTGNAVFGSDSVMAQTAKSWTDESKRKDYETAQKAFRKAQESGNHEEAQRILQDYYNSAGDRDKALMAKSIEKGAIFQTEAAKKKEDKEGFEYEKSMKDAEWLKSKGVRVTDETLMFARHYRELQAKGELTEEEEKKLSDLKEKQAAEAYRNATPGMEGIMEVLTGKGTLKDVIKNPNVSDEDFRDRMQKFAANLGFTGDRDDGSQLLSLFTGSSLGTKNGLGKGLAKLGGHNAEEFARMFGSENLDVDSFAKLADQFQDADTDKERKNIMVKELRMLGKATRKDLDALKEKYGPDATDEQKKEIERMENRLNAIRKNKDDLQNGVVSVDGLKGGGGISADKINELLDKIGVLVDTLKSKGMEAAYRG